jgi:hypothetical protein
VIASANVGSPEPKNRDGEKIAEVAHPAGLVLRRAPTESTGERDGVGEFVSLVICELSSREPKLIAQSQVVGRRKSVGGFKQKR